MLKKLTLAAGFGAGYVLGAKAGRERYTQIEAKFREVAGMPAVQNATSSVKETAHDLADAAKTTVTEKSNDLADTAKATANDAKSAVNEKLSATAGKAAPTKQPVIDLSASGSGAVTGSTSPMAGAAPSATAPDVTRP